MSIVMILIVAPVLAITKGDGDGSGGNGNGGDGNSGKKSFVCVYLLIPSIIAMVVYTYLSPW